MANLLIVDDDSAIVTALKILLKPEGHQLYSASSPEEALSIAKKCALDAVILDMNFSADTTSGDEGLELIRKFHHLYPDIALVAMTGWSSVDLAVQCLQAGASDFVEKPWDNKRLQSIVRTQIKLSQNNSTQNRLKTENAILQQALIENQVYNFVANSAVMRETLSTIQKVAQSELNILLTGENGTGKSVLAHYIHRCSGRHNEKLVSVNAGAIQESLFESELFGHVRGAFTDAKETRIGRFELANEGILFLDEIGNIPLTQQAKLLRVLEEKQFEKVGSSITQCVDVRIIAATNADLEKRVTAGAFRQDLLYRLNNIEIRVPALRERQDDILDLTHQILERVCKRNNKPVPSLTAGAKSCLLEYQWPGNIRELQHVMERSVILADGNQINTSNMMIPDCSLTGSDVSGGVTSEKATLDEIEKNAIEQRILLYSGNMSEAARSLGLSRSAFYRRLEKLAIK